MKKTILAALLSSSMILTACGGGSTSPDGNNNGGNGNSTLITKFAACPQVSPSADPASSACLAGTYTGKTPAGAACSLTVALDGSYSFVSPSATFSYTTTGNSIRIFGHEAPGDGSHVVVWLMSGEVENTATNPLTITHYELNFNAKWGPTYTGSNSRLEIAAKKTIYASTTTNEAGTCTILL